MRRQIVAMGVACLVASTVGSALAQAFYPIDFSSQANYSWVRKAYYATTGPALPGAPTGAVTLGGIPFNITSDSAGDQAWNAAIAAGATSGGDGGRQAETLTMGMSLYGVTNVYTLINTWDGQSGPDPYAWLTFIGTGGASYTKLLVGNVDIRDYNNDGDTNSINGTTTTNVFNVYPDNIGSQGRLDMQSIALPSAFATQQLTSIQLIDYGGPNFQRSVLDGVTISSVPEPGDANDDGTVDINDLTIVLTNFGQTGMAWSQGEFTGDGTVDINDLTIVLANFGQSTGAAGIRAVPEPATIAVLLAGAACLLGYAWRRRRRGGGA